MEFELRRESGRWRIWTILKKRLYFRVSNEPNGGKTNMKQITLSLPDDLAEKLMGQGDPDTLIAQLLRTVWRDPEAPDDVSANGKNPTERRHIPFSQWWRENCPGIRSLPKPGKDPRLDYLRERYKI
jgi:hypothetical protein